MGGLVVKCYYYNISLLNLRKSLLNDSIRSEDPFWYVKFPFYNECEKDEQKKYLTKFLSLLF